ncbi:MAG: SUMF1/EgtB/PvdO family nonheme iron enzyme, partial [Anaerolineales bacterium]|nr:SUMF1/EgtB/PvdO family nonheme iron enzyme [Anaerolineales bacterium]
ANDLEAHGYDIWIAPDSIRPGEKWAEAISRGLDESSFFMLVLTPEAVSSRWVRDETFIAIEMEKENEIAFLPLQVKVCRLPALWRAYQRIPFRAGYDTGLNQLLFTLNPTHHSPKPTIALLTEQPTVEPTNKPTVEPTNKPTNKPPQIKVIEPKPPHIVTPPDRIIWPKDGKEMVLVPAGEFLYGESKVKLTLLAFYIDKTPVTNAEYKLFLDANSEYKASRDWDKKRQFPNSWSAHPVVGVSWHDAQAYANWTGKLLPSEHQWEKAARGTDGRNYPWGDSWRENHCNTRESGIGGTSPVGQFSPQGDSPYGCMDMSGNVWEWMLNWYNESQKSRALRGGAWGSLRWYTRVSNRGYGGPDFAVDFIGFRLVAPVGSGF